MGQEEPKDMEKRTIPQSEEIAREFNNWFYDQAEPATVGEIEDWFIDRISTLLGEHDEAGTVPVKINRITSGAVRGKGRFLITERPVTGSAFNVKALMDAIVYGPDAKYFRA